MRFPIGLVLFALGIMQLAGCGESPTPTTQTDGEKVGIRVTSPLGLSVLPWGNPSTADNPLDTASGGVGRPPVGLALRNPYPNPMKRSVTLAFAMQTRGAASVRVEQIGFPGWTAASNALTGATVTPNRARPLGAIVDQTLEAGSHEVLWEPEPGDAPTGIYRIHVTTPSTTEWRDVMLYHAAEELPTDLRPIVAHWE